MEFEHIIEPASGSKISIDSSGKLIVPDNPIIPFIEGDGIGREILWKQEENRMDGNLLWREIYSCIWRG